MNLTELFESEDMNIFMESNKELIQETTMNVGNFVEGLKEYVYDNPTLFVEENLEDMYKNIRVFTEVATEQYLHEATAANASRARIVEALTPENALNDYI